MKRWAVAAAAGAMMLGAMMLGAITPGRAQTPPGTAFTGRPDDVALIIPGSGTGDIVDVTYARAVPHAQAQRDLDALAQASGWVIGPSRITDARPPVREKLPPMTSAEVTIPGVIQPASHTLPVEPFVTAFRPYKRLVLIFSVGSGFQFQGVRDYADNNVQIALLQRGTAYTYQVRILNPQFSRLSLPGAQSPAALPPPAARRASRWALLLGVLAAAGAAGGLVYVVMARKIGPPPPANTDALSEERVKIGTRG